jgi:hypothetical protein
MTKFKVLQHSSMPNITSPLLFCSFAVKNEVFIGHTILEVMLAKVPFEQQQPAAQAMLQAIMKQLVRNAKRGGLSPRLLQVLPRIPLMHTKDYEQLLQLAETGGRLVFGNAERA